jgi:GH35 family endo-1,4-beta-xylanase
LHFALNIRHDNSRHFIWSNLLVLRSSTFSLLIFFFVAVLCGQELPSGGTPLVEPVRLSPDRLDTRFGNDAMSSGQIVSVTHPQFDQALQVTIAKQPANTWDVGANTQITSEVNKGDLLLVGFWARGTSDEGKGGGVCEFVFERNGGDYAKSVQYLVETPPKKEWKHYWVRFRSIADYQPGEALLNFQMGYVRSTIELAGIQAWNFANRITDDQLPSSELTYVGRDADAPWRVEAAARIEEHRKAEIRLTVVDANGHPAAGVPVHLSLARHAFDFGSAVSAEMLTGEGDDFDRYRETLQKHFNAAVIENGLKWTQWAGNPHEQPRTIKALHWLQDHKIPSRGHVMVWPGHRNLPDWIKPLEQTPDALSQVVDGHIREVGYAAGEMVCDWDVLNEVFDNPDLTKVLGDEAMTHWFEVARAVAPNAKLFYNDYAGLVRGGFPTGHKDHFEKTIRYLIDNKAPIDGIGIQGHFGSLLTPPHRLISELDRWGALGLDIKITEFDVTVPGDQLRADFTRDFLTACFSHPDVDGIITWGFWAGAHWKPDAALFDKDWQPTPIGEQWITLINKEWRTDETLNTDQHGKVTLRGFLGQYDVTIGEGTDAATSRFRHDDSTTDVTLRIE